MRVVTSTREEVTVALSREDIEFIAMELPYNDGFTDDVWSLLKLLPDPSEPDMRPGLLLGLDPQTHLPVFIITDPGGNPDIIVGGGR